jgi:hypothetical protein
MGKLRSIHTTMLGVLMIVVVVAQAGVALLQGHAPNWSDVSAQLIAAIGLIKAADAKQ